MKNIQQLIIRIIIFASPLVIMIIMINYFVDPANIFHFNDQEYKQIASTLQKSNIAGLSNYDELLLQKFYIQGRSRVPNTVIIGSSRSMQIGSKALNETHLFNNSVSGATLKDYYAIYELWREKKMLPKTIIIGIDSWIFNENNDSERRRSLDAQYNRLMKVIYNNRNEPNFEKFRQLQVYFQKIEQLFSLSYFQSSIYYVFNKEQTASKRWRATNKEYEANESVKLTDGTINYPDAMRNATLKKVNTGVRELIEADKFNSTSRFNRLSPILKKQFEDLLELIKKDGVQVSIFLPPYHPIYYEAVVKSQSYATIIETEKYVNILCKEKRMVCIGSYDPNKVGFSTDDFYDFMHLKRDSLQKYLLHMNK